MLYEVYLCEVIVPRHRNSVGYFIGMWTCGPRLPWGVRLSYSSGRLREANSVVVLCNSINAPTFQ
jgi:hypothetical protein